MCLSIYLPIHVPYRINATYLRRYAPYVSICTTQLTERYGTQSIYLPPHNSIQFNSFYSSQTILFPSSAPVLPVSRPNHPQHRALSSPIQTRQPIRPQPPPSIPSHHPITLHPIPSPQSRPPNVVPDPNRFAPTGSCSTPHLACFPFPTPSHPPTASAYPSSLA